MPSVALPVAQEAVGIYRDLAETDRVRYLPRLANSLASLGAAQARAGRTTAALTANEEAAGIYRSLAADAEYDFYQPERASVLAADKITFWYRKSLAHKNKQLVFGIDEMLDGKTSTPSHQWHRPRSSQWRATPPPPLGTTPTRLQDRPLSNAPEIDVLSHVNLWLVLLYD
jgi:hypothetical protein